MTPLIKSCMLPHDPPTITARNMEGMDEEEEGQDEEDALREKEEKPPHEWRGGGGGGGGLGVSRVTSDGSSSSSHVPVMRGRGRPPRKRPLDGKAEREGVGGWVGWGGLGLFVY